MDDPPLYNEMRAERATKPILEVLVSPVGLRCAVLALG